MYQLSLEPENGPDTGFDVQHGGTEVRNSAVPNHASVSGSSPNLHLYHLLARAEMIVFGEQEAVWAKVMFSS